MPWMTPRHQKEAGLTSSLPLMEMCALSLPSVFPRKASFLLGMCRPSGIMYLWMLCCVQIRLVSQHLEEIFSQYHEEILQNTSIPQKGMLWSSLVCKRRRTEWYNWRSWLRGVRILPWNIGITIVQLWCNTCVYCVLPSLIRWSWFSLCVLVLVSVPISVATWLHASLYCLSLAQSFSSDCSYSPASLSAIYSWSGSYV